ncbi:hypothetical protein [Streptomyces griseorubiginosus]|nr:hypothetical protein [Streptomyces griseorubiginosus]WUB41850.1 hypothetical protein OHN19_00305 [Streptomyces griseorubiginosus]WUB50370.1 hypothetical protein OG942_00300 [Streptomyces griseorubiginosus]
MAQRLRHRSGGRTIGQVAVIWWGYDEYSCDYYDGSGKWQLYVR